MFFGSCGPTHLRGVPACPKGDSINGLLVLYERWCRKMVSGMVCGVHTCGGVFGKSRMSDDDALRVM